MEYDKKKETTPIETVERIKSILKSIGINSLEEMILGRDVNVHCCESLRIFLKEDFFCGTNGKGTTLEYAKASAYAEFMERIQYPYILSYTPVDNKKININNLLNSGILKYFLPKERLNDKKLKEYCFGITANFTKNKFNKCIDTVPYYHVNTGEIKYIPSELRWYTSISTGTSAGNSEYEALVEGISEIFERYIQTKALIEDISFPIIPEEVYIKYEPIKKVIDYIKSLGYEAEVRDASLKGKYPVTCTIIKTIDNTSYFACFGSHPSLPVSIERCLTETFQGIDISNKEIAKSCFKEKGKNNNPIKYSRYENALWHRYIELNDNFFTKSPEYEFNEEYWINAQTKTNKELFNDIINNLIKDGCNIFIRDVNFLGFPAFQIYIPELISCFNLIKDDYGEDLKYHYYKCDRIFKKNLNVNLKEDEIEKFFIYLFHLKLIYSHNDYKNLELYYIIFLIYMKKYGLASDILKKMSAGGKFRNKLKIIDIFKLYSEGKINKTPLKDIKSKLYDKYGHYGVNKLLQLYLVGNAFKNLIKSMKNMKIRADIKKQEGKQRKKEIITNILEKYKQNLPNQADIRNLLNNNKKIE